MEPPYYQTRCVAPSEKAMRTPNAVRRTKRWPAPKGKIKGERSHSAIVYKAIRTKGKGQLERSTVGAYVVRCRRTRRSLAAARLAPCLRFAHCGRRAEDRAEFESLRLHDFT